MGTKNSPGEYDCYAHALPDEPIFVLLGRDEKAPYAVRKWARRHRLDKGDTPKYREAMKLARDMEKWRVENAKRIAEAKRPAKETRS